MQAYCSNIQKNEYSCPATVDDIACGHPHVDDEDHEVTMVVMADAVEHPGY